MGHNMYLLPILVFRPVYSNIDYVFPYVKIVMRAQLYQQLVKSVIYTYFCFFAYKNWMVRAAVLTTYQAGYTYLFLFFLLIKVVT